MKLVYGVGINDANYKVSPVINGKQMICPFYSRWTGILERCYDENYKIRRSTYKECTVDSSWHYFSNFKAWMETQDWQGKHIDKDLLVKGNKVYGPNTCVFVDGRVNTFLCDCEKSRGKYPLGVYLHKPNLKFRARVRNGEGKLISLGLFNDVNEAHEAWRLAKHKIAIEIASQQNDPRVEYSLRNLFSDKE